MSQLLEQGQGVETVAVQAPGGVDGQGKPTYGTAASIKARVVREDSVVKQADGDEVVAVVTAWIDAAQSPMPDDHYRVTFADGLVGIVVEVKKRKNLMGALDHVRIKAQKE